MKASRFLAALDATLPPERLQHGRVERSRETIADSAGSIGRPYIAEGLLGMLERRGQISRAQRTAGEHFAEWFRIAQLDPLRAADMGRVSGGRAAGDLPPTSERARQFVGDVMTVSADMARRALWPRATSRKRHDAAPMGHPRRPACC